MLLTNYINKPQLYWLFRYLFSKIGIGQIGRWIASAKNNSIFLPNCELLAGWYMLEVKVDLQNTRSRAELSCETGLKGDAEFYFNLTLNSGRLCKRIIHLKDNTDSMRFEINIGDTDFSMRTFRLVMVSEKFACSRMLTKLLALHPIYRYKKTAGHSLERKNSSLIWIDYCKLFDKTAQLFSYEDWIREFDSISSASKEIYRKSISAFCFQPLISIVMRVSNPNLTLLEDTLSSVCAQIYKNWELVITEDASALPAVRSLLERYASKDERIRVIFIRDSHENSIVFNNGLSFSKGEWIGFLDQEDLLAIDALFWVVNSINIHSDCRLIYSDEDEVDKFGMRSDPYFKCDWNLDLFYSQNILSHSCFYQKSLLSEAGVIDENFGSQGYDLSLRCIEIISPENIVHIPRLLYHSRTQNKKNTFKLSERSHEDSAGERALNQHFQRLGVASRVLSDGGANRVQHLLPELPPLVSLIIPTRNGVNLLRQCVQSILEKTTYARYEIIIIDNGSDDPETLQYLGKLNLNAKIRVVRDDQPFNYSALNNGAIKIAEGEIVGLINNDVEVINPDWLSEMVSHAVRPEVGAVGARLWYADDTIQHAGVVLGIHGIAEHVHRFLPRGHGGYHGRANLIQSFSAVTAACLLVRKSVYEEVGGLNEVELQVACNDVDFCLRVREAGYRNIWTPYAELYHHESASRGFDDTPEKQARSAKEIAYMQGRWGDLLFNDPAYSPNLSLDADDFRLAWPPRLPEFKPEANLVK